MNTVDADKLHRGHAIIEKIHADLKDSALAHLLSGVFAANAAWLVLAVMAFNLTRAAATLTEDDRLAKATTGTIRRKLINIPCRIASGHSRCKRVLVNCGSPRNRAGSAAVTRWCCRSADGGRNPG